MHPITIPNQEQIMGMTAGIGIFSAIGNFVRLIFDIIGWGLVIAFVVGLAITIWLAYRRYRQGETISSILFRYGANRRYATGKTPIAIEDAKAELAGEVAALHSLQVSAEGMLHDAKTEIIHAANTIDHNVRVLVKDPSPIVDTLSRIVAAASPAIAKLAVDLRAPYPTDSASGVVISTVRTMVMSTLTPSTLLAHGAPTQKIQHELASLVDAMKATTDEDVWTAGAQYLGLKTSSVADITLRGFMDIVDRRIAQARTVGNNDAYDVLLASKAAIMGIDPAQADNVGRSMAVVPSKDTASL